VKSPEKYRQGFSLLEIMIVVSIIGILATIAIPNYQKYRARARQMEAKAILSGVYAAEKSFYAEYGTYAGNLRFGGFALDGAWDMSNPPWFNALPGNNLHYALEIATESNCFPCNIDLRPYGFSSWGPADWGPDYWSPQSANCDVVSSSIGPHFVDQYRGGVASGIYPAPLTENSFESVVGGCPVRNIVGKTDATQYPLVDVWSINQDRVLKNQQSGL
jgi:prepilin-type N-terminal cleavage/methylation domain-containing protein